MNVKYIFHSSFLVETSTCYYLFDYYKGKLPSLNKDKPILVFSSHGHQDHYNPEVFSLLQKQQTGQITAVLSKDISPKKYPVDIEVIPVTFHQTYHLPYNTKLETLLSTDEGVAFLLTCPDGTIYHGGDLHDWVWDDAPEQTNKQMTGSYRHEIDLIKDRIVDLAFLPLDPRQEHNYARGILYFLKKIRVKKAYPMHYWEQPQIIRQFYQEYPEYQEIIEYTEDYQ